MGTGGSLYGVSLVVPTYRRERVLLETVQRLLALDPSPDEILLVDQTPRHEPETEAALAMLEQEGLIRRIRLEQPSIPHAMNVGLLEARHEIVLFTDDDVVPDRQLIAAHRAAHQDPGLCIVAGRVFQPWDNRISAGGDGFTSDRRGPIKEFMGGNVSFKRGSAITHGGFDENFVCAAYRFEKECSERFRRAGCSILYEPAAVIDHLKADAGGTREHGQPWFHPGHGVGEYYFLMRTCPLAGILAGSVSRLLRSVATRRHLQAPWRIPVTLAAEMTAFAWALLLTLRGPRLLAYPGVEAVPAPHNQEPTATKRAHHIAAIRP